MKAVFFDFDGVLTTDKNGTTSICKYISRTVKIDCNAFETAYRRYNERLSSGQLMHRDIWDYICKELHTDIPYDCLFRSFIHTPIDNDMIRLVKQLRGCGLKTGMITDNKRDRIDAIMAYYNWYHLFDAVTVSADIGSGKSHIDIFNSACNNVAVTPNESIFIDNSEKNLLIPQKMGMHTFLYNDAHRDTAKLITYLQSLGISC